MHEEISGIVAVHNEFFSRVNQKSKSTTGGWKTEKEENNQSLPRSLLNENKSIALITNRTFNDPQEIVGENYFNFLGFPLLHLHLFILWWSPLDSYAT